VWLFLSMEEFGELEATYKKEPTRTNQELLYDFMCVIGYYYHLTVDSHIPYEGGSVGFDFVIGVSSSLDASLPSMVVIYGVNDMTKFWPQKSDLFKRCTIRC
jgi:hypothetical protein